MRGSARHCLSWVDVLIGFDDLRRATEFANLLGEQDGLLLKELGVVAAPVPHDNFMRHKKFLPRDKHVVMVMVADFALEPMLAFTRRFRGAELLMRSDTLSEEESKGLPPVFELSWNHTTLRALRVDPSWTYLQVLYPFPNQVELVEKIHARFGDEVPCHLEFVRFDGKVTCFGLPLVKFTTEERLEEIMAIHEEMGAPIFNPHRYTLEEGGMKQTDETQLAFKREADPQGLLNPGKMIAGKTRIMISRAGRLPVQGARNGDFILTMRILLVYCHPGRKASPPQRAMWPSRRWKVPAMRSICWISMLKGSTR